RAQGQDVDAVWRAGRALIRPGPPSIMEWAKNETPPRANRARGFCVIIHRRAEMASISHYGIEPDPVIEAYKKDVDRTLIRENLRRSVTERLENLMALQEFAEEIRDAAKRAHATK